MLQSQLALLKETRTVNTFDNTIFQKNKAALILVVPDGYPLICHSQTEWRGNKGPMLFPYYLEHTVNKINNN